jgi:hypothetical protein
MAQEYGKVGERERRHKRMGLMFHEAVSHSISEQEDVRSKTLDWTAAGLRPFDNFILRVGDLWRAI